MPRKKKTSKTSRKKKQQQAEKSGAKAEFIRKHPDLSVGDLVAAAQKAGIAISRPQVYGVRKAAQAKLRKSEAKQMTARAQVRKSSARRAPGEATGSGKARVNKSEFIRSQPLELSAKQVVEAAAKRGMKVSAAYVSNIRSHAKVRQRASSAAARSLQAARVSPEAGASGARSDAEFRKLVLELGVPRANQLLGEVAQKLKAIIEGQ
jgi:hypothetical protein